MSWRLTLRTAPPGSLDVAGWSPAVLAALDERALLDVPIAMAGAASRVGEWFDARRIGGEALELEGETRHLDRIGAHLRGGTIVVRGGCGAEAGYAMRGGRLEVHGSAGHGLACGLRGGTIEVHGDAGDGVGGAVIGERQGMRGGRVLVHGNVGAQCGTRMRRGEILVGGDAGALCAARLIAGTLTVRGRVGGNAGVAMKRGSLILGTAPDTEPDGFEATGAWPIAWLVLLAHAWRGLPSPWGALPATPPTLSRSLGDRRAGGRGELLVWPALGRGA
jgi:formylmethanofuran dehydrogenase subunit C